MITRIKRLSVTVSALIFTLTPLMLAQTATASVIVNQYPIVGGGMPDSITSGPDGALWVGVDGGRPAGSIGDADAYIYRVSTSGSMSYHPVTFGSDVSGTYDKPNGITTGPDGALWFTLGGPASHNFVGQITTSGNVTKYAISTNSNPQPSGITTGPDGNLWFAESQFSLINSISTSGTIGSGFTTPNGVHPFNIVTGPDGALWFTATGNNIYRMTTSGVFTAYPISSSALDITNGPDGALWFTEFSGNLIGRITTDGNVSEYPVPTAASRPYGITNGPDGALWFSEYAANKIGRITSSGSITELSLPVSHPAGITTGSDGNLWFTEDGEVAQLNPFITAPSAPANLTATTPSQNPSLSWGNVQGADYYKIYRNGTLIDSINPTSYVDYNAPEGTNTYYVTAVNTGVPGINAGGESGPSNSVSVLVDRTAPTITYSVSPTPNSNGWNNGPVTVTYTCTDNTGGSGIASCSSPQTESADGSYTLSGTAVDNAGNSSSVNVTVNLDQTAPTLGTPSWTNNPMATSQTTTVTVPATDNLSGVAKGEYYLGTSDPGQGNGTPMTLSGGNLTASFANLTANVYTINFRAEDNAGNWSAPTTDSLVVYGSGTASGHGSVTPSSSDTLPTETGNNIKADFVFSLKYMNPTDTTPTGMSTFMYGSQCHNPHNNCFTVTTDNTVTPTIGSLSWLVIPGNNTATFQGTASLSQGTTSLGNNYPIRVTVTGTTTTASGHYELQIYQVGANPNSATPIYQVSEDLSGGNVTLT